MSKSDGFWDMVHQIEEVRAFAPSPLKARMNNRTFSDILHRFRSYAGQSLSLFVDQRYVNSDAIFRGIPFLVDEGIPDYEIHFFDQEMEVTVISIKRES